MATWTGKPRQTSSFTAKPKANPPVNESYLKISPSHFLNIGSGFKLIIQPLGVGQSWSAKPRAT